MQETLNSDRDVYYDRADVPAKYVVHTVHFLKIKAFAYNGITYHCQ